MHYYEYWPIRFFSTTWMLFQNTNFVRLYYNDKGNNRVRSLICWDQLLYQCFGQLTFRQSLRGLTSTVDALGPQCYHMGIKPKVSCSPLSDANANRPWQIYHHLADLLIRQAQGLYHKDSSLQDVAESVSVYGLDSSTIDPHSAPFVAIQVLNVFNRTKVMHFFLLVIRNK